MVRIDSASLNGLRGLASMHVALGHFFIFSKEPTEGMDLIGGAVMPLFFILSGFVMVVGYGQKRYKLNPSESCGCCCRLFDAMGCCVSRIAYANMTHEVSSEENSYNPKLYDDPEASFDEFPSRRFYNKRISRLAPVYYFTNLLAIPLSLIYLGMGFFIYTVIVSLFVISSWLIVGPLNGVLWTISTMSFFYCMFPHLIVRLQKLKSAIDFRRMFPPNRIPVFVMGCCAGYLRILANYPLPQESTLVSGVSPSATSTAQSLDRLELVMSQKPFCVSTNNVVIPAIIYMIIVLFGFSLSTVSPAGAFLLRVLVEPAVPILFFDWILTLTRQNNDDSAAQQMPGGTNFVEQILQSRFLLFMGKISLSFYACHLLLSGYVGAVIFYLQHGKLPSEWEELAIPSWAIVVVFPLSILCGWLITTYIEVPIQKLLLKKLEPPRQRIPSAEPDSVNPLQVNRSIELSEGETSNNLATSIEMPNSSADVDQVRVIPY